MSTKPEHSGSEPSGSEHSGLRRRAVLSTRALNDALDIGLRADPDAVVDLRADAYGHGAHAVEERARARGASRFLRDDDGPEGMTLAEHLLAPYGYETDPVLRVEGEVVAVKRVPRGSGVSYGYSYRTADDTTLALVALGYADGIPRLASNQAKVGIGAARGVVAGRIAMDQLVVDLGNAPVAVGDTARLWHDAPTLAQWCVAAGRTAQALTTRLGRRIDRVWVDA